MSRERGRAGTVLVGIGMWLVLGVADAEVYRWTDADGVVHFSDSRPPAAAGLEVDSEELASVPVIRTRSGGDFRYRDPQPGKGRKARTQAEDQKLARACSRIEAQLERVQSQLRAGYREPRGNRLREKRRSLRGQYARDCR